MSGLKYGLGYILDPHTYEPDARIGRFGTAASPSSDFYLMKFARFDLNQFNTNSCVWQAHAQCFWILAGLAGRKQHLLSPLAGYYATRKKTAGGGPIFDLGCRPGDAMSVLKEVGWVPWSEHEGLKYGRIETNVGNWDTSLVDEVPNYAAFQAAQDRTWIQDIRIESEWDERCSDIRHMISVQRRPVCVGLVLDSTYSSWKASHGPWKRTGPAIGRHMVTLAGYEPGAFYAIGSYGRDNAENNVVKVSEEAIASSETDAAMYMDIDWSKCKS